MKSPVISLRSLIIVFVLLTALATLGNSLFVAWSVQRDALIDSTLENNRAYAAKVASSLGEFLRSAHRRLGYSADLLAGHMKDANLLRSEALRLQSQDSDFNSIVITDANGTVLQAYPDTLQIVGTTLRSEGIVQALKARSPLVSRAYTSVAGNLVVVISQPIIGPGGEFLGTVGGSVYLLKLSSLHTVIGSHFHNDGTFAEVVDANRRVIFSPDSRQIGQIRPDGPLLATALGGNSGAQLMEDDGRGDMLVGYAPVPDANWAVLALQPQERALGTLPTLMRDMTLDLIPTMLIGLVLVSAGILLIIRPLNELARSAKRLSTPETAERLGNIRAWYIEAYAIRQALLTGVQLLQQKLVSLREEAQSDPLTGLANRRAMQAALAALEHTGQAYAVLALDIDHFKQVNDKCGHDVGDFALRQVADVLMKSARLDDVACRVGGEEFVIVLPHTTLPMANQMAERIRLNVSTLQIPHLDRLTISIGVACRTLVATTAETVLKRADEELYRAKQRGRNRVEVCSAP